MDILLVRSVDPSEWLYEDPAYWEEPVEGNFYYFEIIPNWETEGGYDTILPVRQVESEQNGYFYALSANFPKPSIGELLFDRRSLKQAITLSEKFDYQDLESGVNKVGLNLMHGSNEDTYLHIWRGESSNYGLQVSQRCSFGTYNEVLGHKVYPLNMTFKVEFEVNGNTTIIFQVEEDEIYLKDEVGTVIQGYFDRITFDSSGLVQERLTECVPGPSGIRYWLDRENDQYVSYDDGDVVRGDLSKVEEAVLKTWLSSSATNLGSTLNDLNRLHQLSNIIRRSI